MISVLDDVDSMCRRFESMEDGVFMYRTFVFRFIAETAKVSLPMLCDLMYDSIIKQSSEALTIRSLHSMTP